MCSNPGAACLRRSSSQPEGYSRVDRAACRRYYRSPGCRARRTARATTRRRSSRSIANQTPDPLASRDRRAASTRAAIRDKPRHDSGRPHLGAERSQGRRPSRRHAVRCALLDGVEREASCTRDHRKSAAPDRLGLGTRPQPRHALIHRALERDELRVGERLGPHVTCGTCRSRPRDPVDPESRSSDQLSDSRALSDQHDPFGLKPRRVRVVSPTVQASTSHTAQQLLKAISAQGADAVMRERRVL